MYRLYADTDQGKAYLHTPKAADQYGWEIIHAMTTKPTTGKAKKFITKDDATEFLGEIEYAKKYIEKISESGYAVKPKYEFRFGSRNEIYTITEDIASMHWEIEAIHDEARLTHEELCKAACTFLRGQGCALVINQPDFLCNNESPDAIGFHGYNESHLVEAKTSRADFLADARKWFRMNPEQGVGRYRWFICEPDLISIEDLPDGWGLVYAVKGQREVVKEASRQDRNILAELYLLYQTARRGLGGRDKE